MTTQNKYVKKAKDSTSTACKTGQLKDPHKVNYGKINYNDYCEKNKIDKARNYHYLRENGYYNYNNAINAYRGRQGNVNRYGFNQKPNNIYNAMQFGNNNGPNIVNIKK